MFIVLSAEKTEKQLSLLRLFEAAKQTKVFPNILFADARRRQEEETVAQLDERPLTTHARELQKGCYCRSVSAIHQGSPLILDFKVAFKE